MSAPAVRPRRRALHLLALACVVLVTHGSLYPWRFEAPRDVRAALLGMLFEESWWTGLGDVVGNVALFVPVGVLGMLILGNAGGSSRWRLTLLVASSLAFALVLQVLQLWIPAREAAISDVAWNMLGLAAGIALAGLASRLPPIARSRAAALPVCLAALWLAIECWPLVPTIDWQHVKDALKPLVLAPRWNSASAIETALGVAALAQLLRARRHRAASTCALVAAAALGKLLIAGQSISLGHASGWLAGLTFAALVWRVEATRAALVVFWAALLWYALDELRPYSIAEQASRFEWLPFVGALQGSLSANALALLVNAWWLGIAMVLAAELGARLGALAIGLGACVLFLESIQTWLPGRIAEVTPALMPAFWWLVLRAFRR